MKFKFRLSLPLRDAGHVTAETECAPVSGDWRERLTELASQAAQAAPEGIPAEPERHPGRLDSTLVDDLMSKL